MRDKEKCEIERKEREKREREKERKEEFLLSERPNLHIYRDKFSYRKREKKRLICSTNKSRVPIISVISQFHSH